MFVDNKSKVDREALREYCLKKLTQLDNQAKFMLENDKNKDFWTEIHETIGRDKENTHKNELLEVLVQIAHLPEFIESWIHMAVDSNERFDFFVRAKAEEIASGDEKRDYFWAMQIRHDQLVALLRVLELLIKHIERWVKTTVGEVLEDPIFLGLTEHNVEEQIYLEAELVKKEREKLL